MADYNLETVKNVSKGLLISLIISSLLILFFLAMWAFVVYVWPNPNQLSAFTNKKPKNVSSVKKETFEIKHNKITSPDYYKELKLFQSLDKQQQEEYLNMSKDQKLKVYGNLLQ